MKPSKKCIELIKRFEGFRAEPYYCSANVLTIGYGHTKNVNPTDKITEKEAVELLKSDLAWATEVVNKSVKVPLLQNEFDALVSLVYNIGSTAFRNSTLLQLINAGNKTKAGDEFIKWKLAKGRVIPGLLSRRKAEAALFLNAKEI